MTPEEINRAITEELNLPSFGLKKRGYWYRPNGNGYTGQSREAWRLTLEEAKQHEYLKGSADEHVVVCQLPDPDFFNDLNACHEMEKDLTAGQSSYFAGELRRILGFHSHTYFDIAHATAPQRCEAFLRTVGKWKK